MRYLKSDASMRICVISHSRDLASLLECHPSFTVLPAKPGEAVPDADLYIWDCVPDGDLRRELAARPSAQHFLLSDAKYLDEIEDLQGSACILLKPVTAFTLRAFAELARKSWQLRQRAHEADSLRSDRDALLQYVLEVNLKLQEYDQERSNFLARALHDFRAPLTALHGYCELLLAGKIGSVTGEQRSLLDRMRTGTKRLTRLAGGALELLSEGRVERPSVRTPGDIGQTLNDALHDIYPLLKDKDLELRIDVQPPGGTLLFETEQIQQVLVNLLENSSKFTPRRGTIRICAYPTYRDGQVGASTSMVDAEPPNAYRVDISDSGPGVPVELVDKIFEQYASYSGGFDRSVGGLGLAICRAIITAHSGTIWATPSREGGRFSFLLPLGVPTKILPDPSVGRVALGIPTVVSQ